MKIVRYFKQHEDDDSGVLGYIPLWVPKASNFNAGSAPGMVHDMIEHRLCDTGKFYQEVMAIGRLMAMRGFNGIGFSQRSFGMMTMEEALGREVEFAYRNAQADEPQMHEAPAADTGSDIVEFSVKRIVRVAMRTIANECDSYGGTPPGRTFASAIGSWLRVGYMDALRKYRGESGCSRTGYAAFQWAADNEKRLNRMAANDDIEHQNGHVLRLCWDTDLLEMTERVINPDPEYGRFPGWLRQRIHWWANARV